MNKLPEPEGRNPEGRVILDPNAPNHVFQQQLGNIYAAKAKEFTRITMGRLGVPEERAEEIVQDGFANLMARREGIRNPITSYGYVLNAVIKAGLDEHRRNRRHEQGRVDVHRKNDEGETDDMIARFADPNGSADISDSQHAIRAALSRLDETDRQLLLLAHVEEANYSRISEKTGIPYKEVGRALAAARVRLQALLQAWEEEDEAAMPTIDRDDITRPIAFPITKEANAGPYDEDTQEPATWAA